MGFSGMIYPYCSYTGPACRSGFNQIGVSLGCSQMLNGLAHFGDDCQVSQQRGNPESRSGHSRVLFPTCLCSEEGWEMEGDL